MDYKLLIEVEIQFASPFKRLLSPGDVIRGAPAKLTFFATNLGTRRFPGGKVRNWRILFGPAGDVQHTSATASVQCKQIPAGEKVKLLSEEIMPLTEGLAWVYLSVEPKGKEKTVHYYQDPEELLQGNEWTYCFYVVDRQIVQLSSLIEELIGKLETLKG